MAIHSSAVYVAPTTALEAAGEAVEDELSLGLAGLLYQHVADTREKKVQERVYASQVKTCGRQQWFAIRQYAKIEAVTEHPEWTTVAEFGTHLHDLIEKWLTDLGVLVASEFRLEAPDGSWSGRVDALVKINGEHYVLDIKTVGRKDFDKGRNGPKFNGYLDQVHLYASLPMTEQKIVVNKAIILLVCRDSARMLDVVVPIDPARVESATKRAAAIYNSAKYGTELWPAEEWKQPTGSFYCKNFCPFVHWCREEQEYGSVSRALRETKPLAADIAADIV